MNSNKVYENGMIGLVVGDALGCPVQFMSREAIKRRGLVSGMEGYGTYNMPEGTWTDDSSMALAALASIVEKKTVDPEDIMRRFVDWDRNGAYTPFGRAFDQGGTCTEAIDNFLRDGSIENCGPDSEFSNGNGSLMRILPICIAAYLCQKENNLNDEEAIGMVDKASALTHRHARSKMACGIYWFLVKAIMDQHDDPLMKCMASGIKEAENFYQKHSDRHEWSCYSKMSDLKTFSALPESEIKSSGYVVDSLEAAVWCLITTKDLPSALLKAVNLGGDTDTIAAIAGGLAGLYYGKEAIPEKWLSTIKRLEWIVTLCSEAEECEIKF